MSKEIMSARDYHDKEYGEDHLSLVCGMEDWVSLFAFCDEYAEWRMKQEREKVGPSVDFEDEF